MAETPNNITNSNKAENTQTRILKTVRKVRERYRSGIIHSIKKNQPSIIKSTNNSKGNNKHPISPPLSDYIYRTVAFRWFKSVGS